MVLDDVSLPALLDHLYDGVYVVDAERRIVYWNRAAEEIAGFSSAEVLGTRCSDNLLVHVDAAGTALCLHGCPLQATLRDGQKREAEVFLRHKLGHRVQVWTRVSRVEDREHRVIGAIEIFSDNSARRALLERVDTLERLAMLDQLTELPNRRFLESSLALRHSELARYGWHFGVLLCDIDHFKQINDRFGHQKGDEVLRMVGRTLRHASRAFDAVGRWGGEEFLAVVSHLDAAELVVVAERLRTLVQSASLPGTPERLGVTMSIGGAMAEPDETVEQLLRRTDDRLYAAKHAGRNRVVL